MVYKFDFKRSENFKGITRNPLVMAKKYKIKDFGRELKFQNST
jgi:hypothetical protein